MSSGGSGAGLLLVLTELTGLYAISTILLIRKQLPPKYRCAMSDFVLGMWCCAHTGAMVCGEPLCQCLCGQMRPRMLNWVGSRSPTCRDQADSSSSGIVDRVFRDSMYP